MTDPIDVPERAIAELIRRHEQQQQLKDATDATREWDQADGRAQGYQTAIDILRDMQSNQ